MTTTAIDNAEWIVAFDGESHRLLRNGYLVFTDNTIDFVGRKDDYQGTVDSTIAADGSLIIPGLINTHGHAGIGEALKKSFREDVGSRKLHYVHIYEYIIGMSPIDDADRDTALRVGLAEMLKSGCTTVLEEGLHDEESIGVVESTGIRAYPTRMHSSGHWFTLNGHRVDYDLDVARGQKALEDSVDLVQRIQQGAFGDRIGPLLSPLSPDACLPELLRETRQAAERLNVKVHVHCAQSKTEFEEMMRRNGRTPIECLYDNGLMGNDVMLGHCIFLNDHPMIQYKEADDLGLILETKTNVDYAPWVIATRGQVMHSFSRLYEAGVNMSLGTDTFPQDMMDVMRWAAVLTKVAEGNPYKGTASQVFNAATLGGATSLGRDDLGRLSPGAKADVVIVDLNNLWMQPARDPIKSLVFSASSRAVRTVIVDGRTVVEDCEVLTVDEAGLVDRLPGAASRAVNATFPSRDWAHRTPDEMAPLTFEVWDGACNSSPHSME